MPEIRIGYARDRAFCFYYEENLRMLRQAGAELVPFSPLNDTNLPPALKGLYLGGGYPELHAAELAANTVMLGKIRDFCQSGKPVYAECGGFMYLMKSLRTRDGKEHPMAGVFDFSCVMEGRHQALGYREISLTAPSALGARVKWRVGTSSTIRKWQAAIRRPPKFTWRTTAAAKRLQAAI
jgi:cobyrinic acid a,c-diamide synthase